MGNKQKLKFEFMRGFVFYFDYFGTYDTHYLYRSGGLRYVLCKPVQPCW